MSSGAFSIDQLMELAGLSVSQAGTVLLCHLLDQNAKSWLTKLIQSIGFSPPAVAAGSWLRAVPGIMVCWGP
jgi:hypothetical protein